MLKRVVIFTMATALATAPTGSIVAAEGAVVNGFTEYCEYAVAAHAYTYADGTHLGSDGDTGVFLDAESPGHCAAVAQRYALAHSVAACSGYGAGEAYAIVEWFAWWNWDEIPGSPIVQQYDCGDL